MRRNLAALLALSLAAGALPACTMAQRRGAETAAAKALITPEQELQLGQQVKSELETKEKIKYVTDPEVVNYVNGVSQRILQFASKDRPEVKWQVHVIDDPKTVNAFATPGGFLYVYTGLLLAADNEAELAGVMGHEAGHVVARHSARQMVDAYGLQAVTGMALGQNPNAIAQMAAGLAGNVGMLKFGRDMEKEADEYGATYSSAAGYDPRGLVTFFQKLEAQEGNPGVLQFLSTHPSSAQRVELINAFIAQHNLSGTDVGADRLAPIKRKLGGK
ncbi:M48 family metalloprotease [Aggregicoccus sp. 17bor-14]|uniref:M48 family metallopeptidase n=1 Tax=Myxococcaceae TaxID=31 RepID=UPI00129C4560|nr:MULTISPECIES: M48 family metallopeptidase [Myxococcaceae]MBF5044581.1 M48 family metalloprotease [Simulacricoccus sp. 17bor-14]MRI90325.1 M48 family metalloprotease [Aggregicoccus sp. 17bor-14]